MAEYPPRRVECQLSVGIVANTSEELGVRHLGDAQAAELGSIPALALSETGPRRLATVVRRLSEVLRGTVALAERSERQWRVVASQAAIRGAISAVNDYFERGTIEVAPLAFMRGRSINDSFVILDEAQNTSPEQMKMFLTRLGFNSKIVVTGDVTQIDLPKDQRSGLLVIGDILEDVEGIEFVRFGGEDVVSQQSSNRREEYRVEPRV